MYDRINAESPTVFLTHCRALSGECRIIYRKVPKDSHDSLSYEIPARNKYNVHSDKQFQSDELHAVGIVREFQGVREYRVHR